MSSALGGKVYRWHTECEADCPARATELIPFEGQGFQFCGHHATKIARQLVEKQAQHATMGPTRIEVRA